MHVVEVRPTTAPPGSSGVQMVNVHYMDGTRERVVMRDLTAEVKPNVGGETVHYEVYLSIRRGGCQMCLGRAVGRYETPEGAVAALWLSPIPCPLRVRVRMPEVAHAQQF